MGEATLRGIVAPNFRTPRLIGIFSVVFASELLIVGLCLGGYAAIMPLIARFTTNAQNQVEAQLEASNKVELDALAAKEKTAKTDEEKIEIAAKRKEIQSRPKNPMASMMAINQVQLGDKTFIAYTWTDVLTGVVLNILMLTAGIGLLHWRPWARSLAVWTSAVKIVRLILLYGFFIIVIIPPYCQRLGDAVEQMMTAPQFSGIKGVAMSGGFYARMYTVMYSAFGLGVMLIGVIYPAIVIWCLTRPAVKSACSGILKTPREPNQPC